MSNRIDQAMIMGAGLGLRLLPITNTIPKPMLEIGGKTLIERILEKLHNENIKKVVINIHHKAEMLQKYVESLPFAKDIEIIFSYEEELLESGGIVKALDNFADQPFFVINGDITWFDVPERQSVLASLAEAWDGEYMKSLLLVQQVKNTHNYEGKGDFLLNTNGTLYRFNNIREYPYVFCGVQIIAPSLFAGMESKKFTLFGDFIFKEKILSDGRLADIYGLETTNCWLHIGNMKELELAQNFLSNKQMTLLKDMI